MYLQRGALRPSALCLLVQAVYLQAAQSHHAALERTPCKTALTRALSRALCTALAHWSLAQAWNADSSMNITLRPQAYVVKPYVQPFASPAGLIQQTGL